MFCVGCHQDLRDCTCPGRDNLLREVVNDTEVLVIFKWCRTCDKHYARCRCATPDFYVRGGGREIDPSDLVTVTGERPALDLSPGSERRH